MKVKLVRKQRYIVETHQEVEVDINNLDEDLDELFYDSLEMIISGDELELYQQPDNFDYVGFEVMIDDGDDYVRVESYKNELHDDLPDWTQYPLTTIKDYLRTKKIDKILKQK